MVLTPEVRPHRGGGPLSPLLLAQQGSPLPVHPIPRRSSTGNYSQLSDFHLDPYEDKEKGNGVSEVRHVDLSVNSAEWKVTVFKQKIFSILRHLKVPGWTGEQLRPSSIHLQKVSGALTNAVFFISFNPAPRPTSPSMSPMLTPTMPPTDPNHPPPFSEADYPPTLLLRIYGPSSDALISRVEELRILHVLSTEYGLGPKVYGTFANGRVEQFFPSRALTADELRVPLVSQCIARRMRELHSVDIKLLGYDDMEPMVWRCLEKWLPIAETVISTLYKVSAEWADYARRFDIKRAKQEIQRYKEYVEKDAGKGKGVVFCHNDTQYGNLLKLDTFRNGPEHHRYIVIDFEYSAPSQRGYDIANHFHEWRANYHHPTLSHSLQPHFPYPSLDQRSSFYRAYLSMQIDSEKEVIGSREDVSEERVARLEREVRVWSPASSVFWAMWGIIQAEEQIENLVDNILETDFDYLAYGLERMEMFRKEATELGALEASR